MIDIDKANDNKDFGGRKASLSRRTAETDIALSIDLDGTGRHEIDTGIGFFDHMLTAVAVHGSLDLSVSIKGDLEVDGHHTVEDCGIVLGQAIAQALGDKAGIARFGSMYIPMDEALALAVLDISGRVYLAYDADFGDRSCGSYDLCLTKEFFRALTSAAGLTLHLRLLACENGHHGCEALYKAFAHALRQAVAYRGYSGVLSTKGSLR